MKQTTYFEFSQPVPINAELEAVGAHSNGSLLVLVALKSSEGEIFSRFDKGKNIFLDPPSQNVTREAIQKLALAVIAL